MAHAQYNAHSQFPMYVLIPTNKECRPQSSLTSPGAAAAKGALLAPAQSACKAAAKAQEGKNDPTCLGWCRLWLLTSLLLTMQHTSS